MVRRQELLAVDRDQGDFELGEKGACHLGVSFVEGLQLYFADSEEAYPLGCSVGKVDDAVGGDGAAIVDADEDGFTVLQVSYANPATKGEGAMGARKAVHVVGFAGCGLAALKFESVPGGLADFVPAARFEGLRVGVGIGLGV